DSVAPAAAGGPRARQGREPRVRRPQPPHLDEVHGHRSGVQLQHRRRANPFRDGRAAFVLHRPSQSPLLSVTEDYSMKRYQPRVRAALAAGAAGLVFILGVCSVKDELLAPQQPGVISPGDVIGPTGADGLYVGAVGNFKNALRAGSSNTETIWQFSGLMTDEFKSADTFSQRNDADQRTTQTNDAQLSPIYTSLQQARGYSRTALGYLQQYKPTSSNAQQAEMLFTIAFAEMQLGEDFCNGIALGETVNGVPQYTAPLAAKDVFTAALARVDSGLALATGADAATMQVKNALLITKGRLLVDLGQFPAAAAAGAPVAGT